MDEGTFVLLTYTLETGTTLDEFDSFEEAYKAAVGVVTTSEWLFDEAVIDILTIKGDGFKSVLTARHLNKLVKEHEHAIREREEEI